MKRIRLISVLLLCLVLTSMSAAALAAPKAATTKPTLKITLSKGTIRGGMEGEINITPSVPGFLTLRLLSEDGYELATLCENKEVHTKSNSIDFAAVSQDGSPLSEGTYVLSASMVNEYGTASKETTAKLKIGSPRPTLTADSVSSTKKFKLTVSCDAMFDDKAATVSLSLYRTNPQAMYIDDFDDVELKAPGIASATIDIMDENAFPSGVGYYSVKGAVIEDKNGISSEQTSFDLVIDADGVAYLLEEASEDVLDAVDAAIAKMTGKPVDSQTDDAADETADDASDDVADETADDAKDPADKTADAADDAGKTTAAAPKDTTAYQSGDTTMSEDGLEIGVGVSDTADQTNAGYWTLTSDVGEEEIWAALVRPMIGVDVDVTESAYIYDSVKDGRKRLGTVSGTSQGLNVVKEREDGWSLVEAFRNEDGAFIRGYIRTNKLRLVEPNANYGIVIDKADQKLTVWKDGKPIGSCDVSTGLPTAKYLHRETPAGEYILVTRRGTIEYYGNGFSKYTIRLSGNYHLCEIPTTKKNGSDFSLLEDSLGEKATRGHICVAHEASSDGGINAEWIWDITDANRNIKVLIFDDKDRTEVPVGE